MNLAQNNVKHNHSVHHTHFDCYTLKNCEFLNLILQKSKTNLDEEEFFFVCNINIKAATSFCNMIGPKSAVDCLVMRAITDTEQNVGCED